MRRMGISLALWALCIPMCAQEKSLPQKPPEQRRLIYVPLGTGPAKPLAPEPGDELTVDNTTKEIVIARVNAGGTVGRYRIPLLTNVAPQITCSAEDEGGAVRYSYWLTNGPLAKEPIALFAVGSPKPEEIGDVVTPADFHQTGASLAAWGNCPRYNWHANYSVDLPPGKSAGPFGFHAPLLPGLVRAYVRSRVGDEPLLDRNQVRLSMWLAQKLEEAWSFENNTVQPWIIGPKIDIAPAGQGRQLVEAIRREFLEAASLTEFASERARLTALAERLGEAAPNTLAVESAIKGAGTTPLQQSFYQAMAINLAWLGRI